MISASVTQYHQKSPHLQVRVHQLQNSPHLLLCIFSVPFVVVHDAQGGEHPSAGWRNDVTIDKTHPLYHMRFCLWVTSPQLLIAPTVGDATIGGGQTHRACHYSRVLGPCREEICRDTQGYGWFDQSGSGDVWRACGSSGRAMGALNTPRACTPIPPVFRV